MKLALLADDWVWLSEEAARTKYNNNNKIICRLNVKKKKNKNNFGCFLDFLRLRLLSLVQDF